MLDNKLKLWESVRMKRTAQTVPIPQTIGQYLPALVPVIQQTACGYRVIGYAPIREEKKAA
jgi:hypothetical protein